MAKAGLEARAAAASLMTAITSDGRLLNTALPEIVKNLRPEERARAQRLATGALRWAQRADRLLGPHLRNKPEDTVMNLLRLALYEINVEKTAPHGPVDAAVTLASKSKTGLVNAVLRNVLRRDAAWDDLPLPTLPKWLRKRLIAAWGKPAVEAMEKVHLAPVPLDLTCRDDAAGWAERLQGELMPTGSLRLMEFARVSALAGYDEGAWWVQDAAAAIPARLLLAGQGGRVLDMCAAPGGKTMQLAAMGGQVTALDVSEVRMARVTENLARTGLTAELVVGDAETWAPDQPFEAILLDAPCSATGTLRRHPDLAYAKTADVLGDLVSLQDRLIDRAVGWLAPGGRLVYCTCSLLPEEGEERLAKALERHPDLKVMPCEMDGIDPNWSAPGGGLRIRPDHWADRGGIDGFFIALLTKAG
ncbi:MAG: methyltransferase domain-containing protein [Rhodobacteraceae bacterium]|nr:MAG: methyltransferase domain-containing protein [Paracoccaceae bacterium]